MNVIINFVLRLPAFYDHSNLKETFTKPVVYGGRNTETIKNTNDDDTFHGETFDEERKGANKRY